MPRFAAALHLAAYGTKRRVVGGAATTTCVGAMAVLLVATAASTADAPGHRVENLRFCSVCFLEFNFKFF